MNSNAHNNVYSDHSGNLYRHSESKGWEKYDSKSWQPHKSAAPAEVEHERVARAQGETRAKQYQHVTSGHANNGAHHRK